jgi:endonuclease G
MHRLLAALLLAVSFFSQAASTVPLPMGQCSSQLLYGTPTSVKKSALPICRSSYWTLNDTATELPLAVTYVLTPEHALGCEKRDNGFVADDAVPPPRATPKDYAKSGYDIGHIANAADLEYSTTATTEAKILTNAAPQLAGFNRGIWKKLEDTTRGWAVARNHPLQITAGAIYTPKTDTTIGANHIGVPHAFYKIITDTVTAESQVYLFQHKPAKGDLNQFISSLAEVQKQSGLVIPMPSKVKYTKTWPITQKRSGKTCALK